MLILRPFVIAISMMFGGFTNAQAGSMDLTLDDLIAGGSASCTGNFTLDDYAVQRFDFNSDDVFDLVILDESGFLCKTVRACTVVLQDAEYISLRQSTIHQVM